MVAPGEANTLHDPNRVNNFQQYSTPQQLYHGPSYGQYGSNNPYNSSYQTGYGDQQFVIVQNMHDQQQHFSMPTPPVRKLASRTGVGQLAK